MEQDLQGQKHKNFAKTMNLILCICLFIVYRVSSASGDYYVGAVVEHVPKYTFDFVSKPEAQQIMLENLAIYEVVFLPLNL